MNKRWKTFFWISVCCCTFRTMRRSCGSKFATSSYSY